MSQEVMAAGSHRRRKSWPQEVLAAGTRVRVAPLYAARSAAALNAAPSGRVRAPTGRRNTAARLRAVSSIGRAPRWHCGGNEFESRTVHQSRARSSAGEHPVRIGATGVRFSSGPPMGQAAGCRYPLQGCRRGFDSHLLHQFTRQIFRELFPDGGIGRRT
jgi:hypothetical protein